MKRNITSPTMTKRSAPTTSITAARRTRCSGKPTEKTSAPASNERKFWNEVYGTREKKRVSTRDNARNATRIFHVMRGTELCDTTHTYNATHAKRSVIPSIPHSGSTKIWINKTHASKKRMNQSREILICAI